ncbi:hypothetical protein Ocin01_14933 [Orchesella cincta]|uniref:Uncharacterized protein n=1 Tax=Orchesella cincta TaxID=48709 RepID=A0A1D2MFI8_ORCCI|nr:hypothetical protein Ocin01_14933 [Orchesella cincta]
MLVGKYGERINGRNLCTFSFVSASNLLGVKKSLHELSKMTCCRGCIVKTDAFIAALLSVAVLGFSTYVLTSSVVSRTSDREPGNGSQSAHALTNEHNPTNQSTMQLNATEENVTTESAGTSISPTGRDGGYATDPVSTTPTWNVFSHHNFWSEKSDTYVMLMNVSSGTGIFAAVLQLGFSWLLICGSTKDLKDRTKLWNLSNFIVLILLVVIILVPLSYDTGTNQFKGASTFWRQILRKINSIPNQFSLKTLEFIRGSFSNFLVTDIALYYYILGLDAFLLVCFLIFPFLCCLCYPCRKCCCKQKQSRTDSDVMLFGSSGDTY